MLSREKYHCAVEATVDVAGGKWKPVIIYHLLSGTKRFGELRKLIPTATQRSLTLQLRELETAGVIERKVYAQVPPKVEYTLTEFGTTLDPVLKAMKAWGDSYLEKREKARETEIAIVSKNSKR